VVVMSADLQDPPELIEQMFQKWTDGNKVVIAVRERRNDPFSTRVFASLFNMILKTFGLRNLPSGGFDFCLFDQSLVQELKIRMRSGINGLLLLLLIEKNPSILLLRKREKENSENHNGPSRKNLHWPLTRFCFSQLLSELKTRELYHIRETFGV